MDIRDYGERLKDCILQAVVGRELGRGCFRTVYAVGGDKVVKIEAEGRAFCNIHEWTIWTEVQGTKWERWFAPCHDIDAFGAVLVQARTSPLSEREWAKVKEVPGFLADLKAENWGMLNGRPVCHDYGNHAFFHSGLTKARMVKKR